MTFVRMETTELLLFLKLVICVTYQHIAHIWKKKNCSFFCLLKGERLRKPPIYLLSLKHQFLVDECFLQTVSHKTNKGILMVSYCLCPRGKKTQIPCTNLTLSNLLNLKFESKETSKEIVFFFFFQSI